MAIRFWGTLLIVTLALGGCGDDDGNGDPKDAGPDSSAGKSGSGGKGGTGGSTPPVECGSKKCPAPPNPLGMLPDGVTAEPIAPPVACCLDESTEVCGIMPEGGDMCDAYAVADPRCPSIEVPEMYAPLVGEMGFGCCTANNRCGVEGGSFGRGCVDNEDAAMRLATLPIEIKVPAPRACDDPGDAGADDAGN